MARRVTRRMANEARKAWYKRRIERAQQLADEGKSVTHIQQTLFTEFGIALTRQVIGNMVTKHAKDEAKAPPAPRPGQRGFIGPLPEGMVDPVTPDRSLALLHQSLQRVEAVLLKLDV